MTTIEKIALENDLKKLKMHFNPQHVHIYRLPTKPDCSYCLKFVIDVPSYVAKAHVPLKPIRVNGVTFYMDVLSGYPEKKPLVYYGDKVWPYHVNVFTGSGHHQCTDLWKGEDGSLCQLAEKTVRAIIFDPGVTRYDSKANSEPEEWQRRMEQAGKLPTMDTALLLTRCQRRKPQRIG